MQTQTEAPQNTDVTRYLTEKTLGEHAYVVLLGLKTLQLPELIAVVEKGFAWATFERFRAMTGLTAEQLGEMTALPRRTLARRKNEGRLSSEESDRLVRAARVYGRALRLFDGRSEDATAWLTTPNMALGGTTPLEMMRTDIGARAVEQVIGRAEHGVFS
jgi:putative toxin-antitoxin system antitoxin component (TIGR02293 family)